MYTGIVALGSVILMGRVGCEGCPLTGKAKARMSQRKEKRRMVEPKDGGVTFCTTDPTLSLFLLETLRRRMVDHQTLPVICSLLPSGQFPSWPKSSSTLPYAKSPLPYPRHFTCQWTPFNTCILTQDLGLWSCTEQIPYVQSSLSHVCLIIPHATFYYSTCHL